MQFRFRQAINKQIGIPDHNLKGGKRMKKANADWTQLPLTAIIIARLAELYFDDTDWLDMLLVDSQQNDELFLQKLVRAKIVTKMQAVNYLTMREWWKDRQN